MMFASSICPKLTSRAQSCNFKVMSNATGISSHQISAVPAFCAPSPQENPPCHATISTTVLLSERSAIDDAAPPKLRCKDSADDLLAQRLTNKIANTDQLVRHNRHFFSPLDFIRDQIPVLLAHGHAKNDAKRFANNTFSSIDNSLSFLGETPDLIFGMIGDQANRVTKFIPLLHSRDEIIKRPGPHSPVIGKLPTQNHGMPLL